MSTYAELKAQAEAMYKQAEELRKAEVSSVIAEIKAKMREFNLTLADLGAVTYGTRGAKKASRSNAEPKYRGPNGELWAGGLGRKPQWVKDVMAQGKSIEEFKI